MTDQLKKIRLEPGSELEQLLAEADVEPVDVDTGRGRYRIVRIGPDVADAVPRLAGKADIWAGYDPDRVDKAIRGSLGAISGVDRDQLLRDLAEQRAQDSHGRPEQ